MNKPTFNELLQLWGRFYANSRAVETPLLGCRPQWAIVNEASGRAANLAPEIDAQLIAIDKAINHPKLPTQDKSLLLLRYKYGYSYERLARRLSKEFKRSRKEPMCEATAKNLVKLAESTLALIVYNSLQ